jgi:hypothetical protein
MKKIVLAVLALVMYSGVSMADDANAIVKWGKFEINMPLKNLKVIPGLYDFWQGQGLVGAETQLMAFGKLNLNGGVVTSFIGNGTPFVSLDSNMTEIFPNLLAFVKPSESLYLGPWIGYDFELGDWRAGIKSSIKLW